MKDKDMVRKVEFYFKNKTSVHILTIDERFYNGLIIEFSDKLIILQDRVLGETPINISEIKGIETFVENKPKEIDDGVKTKDIFSNMLKEEEEFG